MLERLKNLEENIAELNRFRKRFSLDDVQKDKSIQWALRYGLLESIQIIIDLSCHLVSKYNLGNPTTYSECVLFIKNHGYIGEPLCSRLVGMIGLRNILIHEYTMVDLQKLYQLLSRIDDFIEFGQKISKMV